MNYNNDTINQIHPLNYEHIASNRPHRLYADNTGCRLELRTHTVNRLIWEVSGRSGVILGVTHSWNWGSQTSTLFLDARWWIFSIGRYSWLTQATMDIMLRDMLLSPIDELDGWVLQDIKQAKREYAHRTYPMIWIKSSWGNTDTFHPHLQQAIQEGESIVLRSWL